MRYECDVEGFEGNFVNFSDSWTRKEIREFWDKSSDNTTADEFMKLVSSKVKGLHLDVVYGDQITEPVQLTEDALDRIDNRLFRWITFVIIDAAHEVVKLGNAVGERLWATVETSQDTSLPTNSQTDG